MYNINFFEKLIRSSLSVDEVCNRILELNPIYTRQKYSNDEEEPFAVYVGGIGENDFVTVNEWNYPLTMVFDDKSVYTDFIKLIRNKLDNGEESFEKVVFASIRNISKSWFYEIDDDISKQNSLLAKKYLEAYKHPGRQRDGYAGNPNVSYTDDETFRTIYGISKFKGVGDLAKCVEVNSIACNLLAFSGFESILIQGYFINYNGKSEAHTFPIYKNSDGNYNLLDCILKMQKKSILHEDLDFEIGFSFDIPVVLTHKDGIKEQSKVTYKCSPQKKLELNRTTKRS